MWSGAADLARVAVEDLHLAAAGRTGAHGLLEAEAHLVVAELGLHCRRSVATAATATTATADAATTDADAHVAADRRRRWPTLDGRIRLVLL